MKLRTKHFVYAVLLCLSLAGCDDNNESSIPDVPVYMELNLTSTYPAFLNTSYPRSITFTTPVTAVDKVGYGGILFCIGFDREYYAFDMSCPYEHSPTTQVDPTDDIPGQAVCEGCGSVFDIGFGVGNPTSGPAKEVLKRYRTTLSNGILYITR